MVIVFLIVCALIVVANVALSIWMIRRTQGWWRVAAALPLFSLLVLGAKLAFDLARNSTSHNLWPFEFLIASIIGITFSFIVRAAQALVRHFGGS